MDIGRAQQCECIMPEVPSFYRGYKVRTRGLCLYYKDQFHLLIHKYYNIINMIFHTPICSTIFCLNRLVLIIDDHPFIASDKCMQKYAHCILLCSAAVFI